jgi:hypothetical protein
MSNDTSKIIIINPRMMPKIVASLIDVSKGVQGASFTLLYDVYSTAITYDDHHNDGHNMFIVKTTDCSQSHTSILCFLAGSSSNLAIPTFFSYCPSIQGKYTFDN